MKTRLSSKHLLQTKSEKIDWPETLFDVFTVDRDQLIPTGAVDFLTIDRDDLYEDEETGELCTRRFTFKTVDVDGVECIIDVRPPIPLILSDEAKEAVDESDAGPVEVPLITSPFYYSMENEELSRSLRMILELIEKNEHLGFGNNAPGILNKFIHLLNESNIQIQSVHVEMIVRELVRRPEDLTERPDFSGGLHGDYIVLRLPEAIIHSKCLSTSLAFQELKRQLHSPQTYLKRGRGLLDGLFI